MILLNNKTQREKLMKKLLYLLMATIISTSLPTFASNIEVLPTMQTRTGAQDRVWVGTF
jgi:hypothetical protein